MEGAVLVAGSIHGMLDQMAGGIDASFVQLKRKLRPQQIYVRIILYSAVQTIFLLKPGESLVLLFSHWSDVWEK